MSLIVVSYLFKVNISLRWSFTKKVHNTCLKLYISHRSFFVEDTSAVLLEIKEFLKLRFVQAELGVLDVKSRKESLHMFENWVKLRMTLKLIESFWENLRKYFNPEINVYNVFICHLFNILYYFMPFVSQTQITFLCTFQMLNVSIFEEGGSQ